ncbi:zinc finger and BTB domain-containing protein 41 [Hoplias malabaricus]|uniref:zinc finger and BTB domain-containing protein 41 n=1 Tax=Hoplias malabaricus TaxID=27720 RepID=UPI003461D514
MIKISDVGSFSRRMKAKKKGAPTGQRRVRVSAQPEGSESVSSDLAEKCRNQSQSVMCVPESFPDKIRSLRISQSDSCFLKFLKKDRDAETSFCDVTISVRGKTFSAHKVVLAFGSSYFHAKLSQNPELDRVTFDNVESSVFRHLLDFLYTSEMEVEESEIPSLAEAACFFDMMEAVNLLVKGAEAAPERQELEEPKGSQEDESTQKKIESEIRCSFCGRMFRYKKSLDNHVAKIHSTGTNDKETVGPVVSNKKLSESRRILSKCEIGNNPGMEHDIQTEANTDETATSIEEEEEDEPRNDGEHPQEPGHSEQSAATPDQNETSLQDEVNPRPKLDEHPQNVSKVDGENGHEVPNTDLSSLAKPQGPAESTRSHVYPEGLAPVVIQSSGKKTLQCPKCNKMFDRIGKYESHTRVHTGEKPFQCEVCLQRYSTKSNLTVHRKKHCSTASVQKKEHKCPFCSKLHASKKTLSKHVKRFHPDRVEEFLSLRKRKSEGWKCEICHKSFTRRPHLEEHMILHSQDRPFKCSYCDDYFKSRFARLKHQEKYHLGPFPCEICGRQFNDTGNRKRHIECTHGGKRKWTCYLCGKSVRERTTLREHLRIHSGEKPHLCSICGQSFRHGSSYRLHLRVHHDDKRYECEECGKTFIRHDHLKKHRKIHTGERAHQCEECGKCFRRADHLTVHYKSIHLGEKVWRKYKAVVHQCEVCKKEFRGKTNLMTHFRTHSGEKPHRCVICNQTFRIKKTLTKHMVIHSDVRPFNCPHCSATFKRKDKLKYHVDHVHSGRPPSPSPLSPESHVSSLSPGPTLKLQEPMSTPEPSKGYKSVLQGDVCVPVALVPVQMTEDTELGHHSVQQQTEGYQPSTDLVFLEKYTLTPQPANIVHPVRTEHILDPREHSYLGTLLGLDTANTGQNLASSDH